MPAPTPLPTKVRRAYEHEAARLRAKIAKAEARLAEPLAAIAADKAALASTEAMLPPPEGPTIGTTASAADSATVGERGEAERAGPPTVRGEATIVQPKLGHGSAEEDIGDPPAGCNVATRDKVLAERG